MRGKGTVRGEGTVDTARGCGSVWELETGGGGGINGLLKVASESTGEVEAEGLSSPVAGERGVVGRAKVAVWEKALPSGVGSGE